MQIEPQHLKVSFIIPTLNESKTLHQLLQSIQALDTYEGLSIEEVIVVDSGSEDGTPDIARSKNCTLITAKPGNVSNSRNIGAEQARGDVLAFIDADCELPNDWLLQVAKKLSDLDVLAAGACMTLNSSTDSWVEKTWYELAHKKQGDGPCDEVNWLATFNLAVRKKAFDAIGGFDATLATCEDVDFGYRLSKTGRLKKIYECGVLHHGESKRLGEFFRREAWRARGSREVLKKNRSDLREIASYLLPIAVTMLAILSVVFALALPLSDSYFPLIMAVFACLSAAFFGLITLLILKKDVSRPFILRSALLLSIYMFARCYGSIRPFDRVER